MLAERVHARLSTVIDARNTGASKLAVPRGAYGGLVDGGRLHGRKSGDEQHHNCETQGESAQNDLAHGIATPNGVPHCTVALCRCVFISVFIESRGTANRRARASPALVERTPEML